MSFKKIKSFSCNDGKTTDAVYLPLAVQLLRLRVFLNPPLVTGADSLMLNSLPHCPPMT